MIWRIRKELEEYRYFEFKTGLIGYRSYKRISR